MNRDSSTTAGATRSPSPPSDRGPARSALPHEKVAVFISTPPCEKACGARSTLGRVGVADLSVEIFEGETAADGIVVEGVLGDKAGEGVGAMRLAREL